MNVGRSEAGHFQLWLIKISHVIPFLFLIYLPVASEDDDRHKVGGARVPKSLRKAKSASPCISRILALWGETIAISRLIHYNR